MSDKRIQVPPGMLKAKAAIKQCPKCGCDVFLRETNQIVAHRSYGKRCEASECDYGSFFAPEPEVPEEVKDLLWQKGPYGHNEAVIEAYRRGKNSKEPK